MNIMTRYITLTLCFLAAAALGLPAESLSYTGSLSSPEDVFEVPFTLWSTSAVTIQTWAFGGGVNANGQTIEAGGFDPLIALFSGTGSSATLVTDSSGNPLVDADNLNNPPWAFVGNCPSAGLVAIGSNNDCGDDSMQITLAAGSYTLLLSDANYIPAALNDNGSISEGFTDLTAGVFQTCDPVADACITPNSNYAVDITSPGLVYPAVLLTPTPSSTLSTQAVTFTWSAGGGVSAYQLCVGDQYAGNCNLYASGITTALSANVTGLPVNGEKLYVRLYSRAGASWLLADYSYTTSGTPVLAALTAPTPGTALPGASDTFQWNTGSGVTGYIFMLGTTGPGSHNLYNGAVTQATSASVTGLPLSGEIIYARLYSQFNGSWTLYNDYTYTGAGASLLTPTPGSTLTASSTAFTWSAGVGVNGYQLCVGDLYAGNCNLYASGVTTALTANVTGLPVNGEMLYVRLYSRFTTTWQLTDYTYIMSGTPVLAALTAPALGSTITSSSATFQWSAGSGVNSYMLMVGSTGPGSHNLYTGASTTALTASVTGLPTTGLPLYVRLYSHFNGSWAQYNDYLFNPEVAATLASPAAGATLAATGQVFTWSPVVGATGYTLYLGTSLASGNLLDAHTTATTVTTGNLPVNGETIFARLWTNFNGVWKSNDYTFTAQ
jgi:hypothetical protein